MEEFAQEFAMHRPETSQLHLTQTQYYMVQEGTEH